MQAELRELTTVLGDSLESVMPQSAAFHISLRAMIGAVGEIGEESFDFNVCSPDWLEIELNSNPVVSGRLLLIMRELNAGHIKGYVRKRVLHASSSSWEEIATKLGRWAYWEFEDCSG